MTTSSPSAAERQTSSYEGVSTADLVVLRRALDSIPVVLAVSAVGGRVAGEIGRRPRDEVDACLAAAREDMVLGSTSWARRAPTAQELVEQMGDQAERLGRISWPAEQDQRHAVLLGLIRTVALIEERVGEQWAGASGVRTRLRVAAVAMEELANDILNSENPV